MSDLNPIRDGRHYDALKAQNDIAFYLAQARAASGPVLEIGCGTGRVTIPLASAGVDIIGLDVSASMLEEAKRKAEGQGLRVSWVQADGGNFDLGRRFALIIMPFNTLQFFRDRASLGQLFHCVKSHLGDEGRFVFDVFNPQVSFLAADPSDRYERARYSDPHGGGEVVLEETREYIAERQVVRSTRYYHVGEKRDFSVSSLQLRCFFPCELDLILEHFGFRLRRNTGTSITRHLMVGRQSRFASVAGHRLQVSGGARRPRRPRPPAASGRSASGRATGLGRMADWRKAGAGYLDRGAWGSGEPLRVCARLVDQHFERLTRDIARCSV